MPWSISFQTSNAELDKCMRSTLILLPPSMLAWKHLTSFCIYFSERKLIAGEFSKLRMFSFPGTMQGLGPRFSSVQSLSRVQLFVTPWTAACQASLSITKSRSLLKLMSIKSVMPSSHLILCCPLLLLPSIFPIIRVFYDESVFFTSGGQSIGVSASATVLPVNIQD